MKSEIPARSFLQRFCCDWIPLATALLLACAISPAPASVIGTAVTLTNTQSLVLNYNFSQGLDVWTSFILMNTGSGDTVLTLQDGASSSSYPPAIHTRLGGYYGLSGNNAALGNGYHYSQNASTVAPALRDVVYVKMHLNAAYPDYYDVKTISLWVNPADTSSEAALGTPAVTYAHLPWPYGIQDYTSLNVSGSAQLGSVQVGGALADVLPMPVSANAGQPKTITPSNPSVTIGGTPTASGGVAPYTYSWTPATGLSSTTVANPVASPTATTTYTVVVTDLDGNRATNSVVVTFTVPALTANAGAPQTVTPSTPSVTLGGSPTASGGWPPYTYTWTPNTSLSSATVANPTAWPTVTTTYTLVVADSHDVRATNSVVVSYVVPDPDLISLDFVTGSSSPVSGNTTVQAGPAQNASGLIYTGQAGSWNGFNIDPQGYGNMTYGSAGPSAPLVSANATGTTVRFAILSSYRCAPGNGSPGLRNETAALYDYYGLSANPINWQITGLVPNGSYQLAYFSSPGGTYTANGVVADRDAEGDANWTNLLADATGKISGSLAANPGSYIGMYGFQLEHISKQPPQIAPASPSPADRATAVPIQPTLDWSECAGAEVFDVYYWITSTTKPVSPSASVPVTQFTVPTILQPFTNYSWQVVARNSSGTTNGPVWTFTTGDGRPVAPANPSPANGATGILVDTILDWSDSLLASGYQLFVWPAGATRPAAPTATLSASTWTPTQPLLGNTNYNWQVVATNAYGYTTGAVWTFTTGDRYPGYLVPWPASVTMRSGDFPITASTRIVAANASLLRLAKVMANDLFMTTGLRLTTLQGTAQTGDIFLTTNSALSGEAYTLDISAANATLSGSNYQAVAWASVTLMQALDTSGTTAKLPQMLIQDQPAAPLRTVMWDVARFFHPLETLYELVDLHRMYKVTYLHLYMSADGLFTFGSDAFPNLKRNSDGNSQAGFYLPPAGSHLYYSKSELTNLVQYAADRGVVIVPEIDTPSWAAFMTGNDPANWCSVGGTTVTHDVNINYTNAITNMRTLMGELADVFSTSPYVHIGADEVDSSSLMSYPYWSQSSAANNYANGGEAMTWYMNKLSSFAALRGQTTWAWNGPGKVGKGYDMPTNMVYTAWGYDDGQGASQDGYWVMRAAGGHVAGYGQKDREPPYNRCILYRPAQGIYNRLIPLQRYIGAPDNSYTDLTPNFIGLTGRENKVIGAHIMEWETPWELEVPAMRLSMPALGEPTWNQNTNLSRLNWSNFVLRQARADQLYQRVMRPVVLSVSTQVDPKDICFVPGGLVTMTSAVPGTIRYTLGTDYRNSWYNFPTSNSTVYTTPFAISQATVISARLFDTNGLPLGNPVTRGFYPITPKVHYKYYYTGYTPAADFETGKPIVRSVMGRMDGDAPQEDIRFGAGDHRLVYSGSLNIATAGDYTFTAAYGGTIMIDRLPVTDGTPVTLTAGEHPFKIITPANGLGTPYTFSGPGYNGADLNVLVMNLSAASQVSPTSHNFGVQGISDGAAARREVVIVNHSVFSDMAISGVTLTGTAGTEFYISDDTAETVLAPGAERVIGLRFDPATTGTKTATLHIVSAQLNGGAADVSLTGYAVSGSTLPPDAPVSPNPTNASVGVSVNIAFDWADSARASGYNVYLWPASGSKPGSPTATVQSSQWTPPAGLLYSTAYKWQVVATNAYGTAASAIWTLATAALQPPSTPVQPVPANGAPAVAAGTKLDWADSTNATGYLLWLWPTTTAKPVAPSATPATSQWTPAASLTIGSDYNWQVVATNIAGSATGAIWNFHVAGTAQVTNLVDGTTLRYPMALLDGRYDGQSLQITTSPTSAAVSFTTNGTRFRCLVDLQPGSNVITLRDSHGPMPFTLVHTPASATAYRYKIWYAVPLDEATAPVDPDWYAHFALQTKLMQSWMAEDQFRAGHGRLTFYPEMDATNNVSVGLLVLSQPRAQIGNGAGIGLAWNAIPAQYKDGLHKNLVFTSVDFQALSSGDLAYVGAYSPILPKRVADLIPSLLSTNWAYDGLTFATYTGVTLHELCHGIHSIWHDFSPNNIMGGAYDISQYFTLTYSEVDPRPHNESSAGTLGNQRDLASWNRYLMSADPQVYNNTPVSVAAGPEYLSASSDSPLAVVQYYKPDSASDLHTNLWSTGVTSFSKHAGQAAQELGYTGFNVMAVDTQGNMSYAGFTGRVPVVPADDTYTVAAGTTLVIAAPGVLGNDYNPSSNTLTAVLSGNVQYGTLVLNANGGFTYTPPPGFSGTDTFTYTASDAVSGDQQARVTLNVLSLIADAGPAREVSSAYPSVQIGGSPTALGGTGPYTYSWTPTTGLSSATVANPTASPTTTTTYTVQVTDSTGTRATDSVVVSYTSPLVVSAGSPVVINACQTSAQIGGNPTASGGLPPYTYTWTPVTSLSSPSVGNPVATPSATTTYSVVVTDAAGGCATSTVPVTVGAAVIGSTSSLGKGQTLNLNYTFTYAPNQDAWASFRVASFSLIDATLTMADNSSSWPPALHTSMNASGKYGLSGTDHSGSTTFATNRTSTVAPAVGDAVYIKQHLETPWPATFQAKTISIWVNPADTSSEAALGTPTLTLVNRSWPTGGQTFASLSLAGNARLTNVLAGVTLCDVPQAPTVKPAPVLTGITAPTAGTINLVGSTTVAGDLVVWRRFSLTDTAGWTAIQTNTVPAGAFNIPVPQTVDPQAFYRLSWK